LNIIKLKMKYCSIALIASVQSVQVNRVSVDSQNIIDGAVNDVLKITATPSNPWDYTYNNGPAHTHTHIEGPFGSTSVASSPAGTSVMHSGLGAGAGVGGYGAPYGAPYGYGGYGSPYVAPFAAPAYAPSYPVAVPTPVKVPVPTPYAVPVAVRPPPAVPAKVPNSNVMRAVASSDESSSNAKV
jgi:hypothetical protein